MSIADALEAPSIDDVTDPQGKTFRLFAEQTKSDRKALAACLRGSRQTLTREEVGRDPGAGAGRGRHQGRHRRLADELAALMPNGHALDIPDRDHMVAVGDKVFKAGVLRVPAGAAHDACGLTPPPRCSPAPPATGCGRRVRRAGQPVLLLHGGGQTRHAWGRPPSISPRGRARLRARSARPRRLRMGRRTAPMRSTDFAADAPRARRYARGAHRRRARSRSALRSAASHRCSPNGSGDKAGTGPVFAALVLVDITPRVDRERRRQDPGLHARARRRGFRHRSRKPPTRSPPICRIARARARTTG